MDSDSLWPVGQDVWDQILGKVGPRNIIVQQNLWGDSADSLNELYSNRTL